MSETQVSVIISGAGPNGLMVACELALAGVRPVVLERLPGPSDEPKANGLIGQVVRLLDMRGLYQRFTGAHEPPHQMYEWIFSGMRIPLSGMANNPMYGLPMQ
jgi:2-polyprenyl-6-methoxyphenol hydroxylase-like FAD-dependent oxidoreductase